MSYLDRVFGDGATHAWKFNEPSGTAAAAFLGGLDGTYSSATLNQDGFAGLGKAASFDGTNGSKMATAASTALNWPDLDGSIDLWVYLRSTGSDQVFIDHTAGTGGNGQFFAYYFSSGDFVRFQHGDGSGSSFFTDWSAAGASLLNGWHHLAFVSEQTGSGAATRRIYLDGVQKASSSGTGLSVHSPNLALQVGQFNGISSHLDAKVQIPAVYSNVVLSAGAVLSHYLTGVRSGVVVG